MIDFVAFYILYLYNYQRLDAYLGGERKVDNRHARKFLSEMGGKEFLIVHDPDHPFVFRGPNALLSMPDNLCAIFIPNAAEHNNPIHLAARLIATRLAYPADTRCILLKAPDDERSWSSFYLDFSGYFRIGERNFRDFIYAKGEMGPSQKVPDNIQFEAVKKFDDAMRVTRLARKISDIKEKAGKSGMSIRQYGHEIISLRGMEYYAKNRMIRKGVSISISSAKKKNIRKSFSHFGELQLIDTYNLDRGVPYPKHQSNIGFIVPTSTTMDAIGNEKLVHATAFCGLAILPDDDLDIVDTVIERSNIMLNRYESIRNKNFIA